ncbi:iron-hydroxamate ABC transporter substrate-binding protein [Pradoshia eiseniae]|uniref:Iron-hydroxamate ABC transporter substrate-binding protein n=1 Tax=Pradoshia eiseniae TaxID=2064768 RepID=A0A2S7N478_9BACI|nr:ABC transporter substrate-binding protein [Pradoshia eiseniae]PQD96826.1 iron-hydroxamate ABC transporter substrate-binding protein [Pradoshia eiseniae]
MRQRFISPALAITFLLGACSSEDANSKSKTEKTGDSTSSITLTDFAGREVSIEKVPERIVSLSGGDMDIIYALGGEVAGRPTSSHEENDAPYKDAIQIGSTHQFNLEKIASLKPDVIIGNNPMNTKDVENFESIGAEALLTSANSVDEIKKQITLYGDMLQKQEEAEKLTEEIDADIKKMSAGSTENEKRALLVYGAPGTYMAALPNSLSGNLLELAGGENIASDYPALEQYPQYAQLNTERIVEANPEYVFLLTHGNPKEVKAGFLKEMSENPAWNNVAAVKNDKVEILPADLFGTNPGTRITEAISYLDNILNAEE